MNPPGGTQGSREFRQAWAASQIEQIQQYMQQLDGASADWIGRNLPTAYQDGLDRGDKQAKESGVYADDSLPLKGGFSQIDRRTIEIFASEIYGDLHKAGVSMESRAARLLRETAQQDLDEADLNAILAQGVIEGRPRDTIRRLKEELEAVNVGTVKIIDKNGDPMEFSAGDYASMVVRTKTREATVKARHNRLEELDLDLVAIVGKVSNHFCTAFLGQVFSLSGKSRQYPAYSDLPGGGPPFHPNCSKSTRPFVPELASKQQIDAADGVEDAESLLGTTPAEAQRSFKDLQLRSQVEGVYATTEKKLFG